MKINLKLIQIASDAVIPLLGFYLWNWSLYFILLFYFIDFLGEEIITHLKSYRIIQYNQQSKKEWIIKGIKSALLLSGLIWFIHFTLTYAVVRTDFWKQIQEFWNYKELGVKQGYFLVPLVLFASYQQYKMTFLMNGKYKTTTVEDVWASLGMARIVMYGFTGLVLTICIFGVTIHVHPVFQEQTYVLAIVFFSSLYKWKFN